MSNSLRSFFPNQADILTLEPEDLAKLVLKIIPSAWEQGIQHNLASFIDYHFEGPFRSFGPERRAEIEEAIIEGWMVLERTGLLVPTTREDLHPGRRSLSRRARQIKDDMDWTKFLLAQTLPNHLLHPSIKEKVWGLLLRGDYDTAVFQAFKEVEVTVRTASGLDARMVGTDLMRAAFHPDTGALTDKGLPKGEREALAHLFAGAIGSYKNPQSHRHVGVPSPEEAAEMVILASHLLRIVDAKPRPA